MKSKNAILLMLAWISISVLIAAPEIADNSIDEDGDGWLATSRGYRIRADHPRVLLTKSMLNTVINRMYGSNAREPYKHWFELMKSAEDKSQNTDLVSLALIYKATGSQLYLDRFIARLPASGEPGSLELYAVDIMFDYLNDSIKKNIIQRVNAIGRDVFLYNAVNISNDPSLTWSTHDAGRVTTAIAYTGTFAFSGLEYFSTFNINNYLVNIKKELSSGGTYYNMERRVGGDPTYNNALPGSFGGMYDNFGYDVSEESNSISILFEYFNLTGEEKFQEFYHDKYRGDFYQNMQYPYLYNYYISNGWGVKAGTESHMLARIWNTQTDYFTQPRHDTVFPLTFFYKDKRVQYYANKGTNRELLGSPYGGMYWDLIYYDDTLGEDPPSTNSTAKYFSGPGLVSMRTDWSNDAAFAVFIAGEGIGRRYEDANSFIMGRKVDVFTHGGARIRGNVDNEKTHWYHIRSISKNTLRILDPLESFDINSDGTTATLNSGTRLVSSDNMGGQIFETNPSNTDKGYYAPDGMTGGSFRSNLSRSGGAFPLNIYETANIIKYEHKPMDGYTYTVGDGTSAYTKKIDFFEREFLFIRPDIFVIFDRVESVNPYYKKVWTVHTIDEPIISGISSQQSLGCKVSLNYENTVISNPKNITYIDSLLPKKNKILIRGGDTVLVKDQPLKAGTDILGDNIIEPDIPRWLEVFAVGDDTVGAITIYGDAEEGNGNSEVVNFSDVVFQTEVSSVPTQSITASTLQDTTKSWKVDQWKNYTVKMNYASSSMTAIIIGNNENTLFGNFVNTASCWQYLIQRPLGNSYKHWKKINRISTNDMNVKYLTVSIPHYFDAEDAYGKLYSFAPHTDSKNDGYRKRKDLGQYTLNIEATVPQNLDNFLNVISLKDPGVIKPTTALIESENVAGAVVGSYFTVFGKDKGNITNASFGVPYNGASTGLIFNLTPNSIYFYKITNNFIELSHADNGGTSGIASSMGVLKINCNLTTVEMDINLDGKFDTNDILSCINHILELTFISYVDVNKDGKVDVSDVQTIVNKMLEFQ